MRSAILILCGLLLVFTFIAGFFQNTSTESMDSAVTTLEERHTDQEQWTHMILTRAEGYPKETEQGKTGIYC